MYIDYRIESAEPLDDGRRIKLAFRNPERAFTLDLTGLMDGSDGFVQLKDPQVFKRVKIEHYNTSLQWGGDEMLEIGADTLFRMAEAQAAA